LNVERGVDAPNAERAGRHAHKLWGGRFAAESAPALDALNRSIGVDFRLWPHDVRASKAWAVALWDAGILTLEESTRMEQGLDAVAARLAAGEAPAPGDEDVHTLIDRLLHEEVGELASKLHTGRSRNDQVSTATRLWCVDACAAVDTAVRALQQVLVDRAAAHEADLMPSYTHLQRAQPVAVAHWLLAHFWPLERDRARVGHATRAASVSPLGSGAVAGCAFPVSRVLLKESLGFGAVAPNSVDAVGDRDFVADLLYAVTLLAVHLSRLAEDLILFGSSEFGFVRFGDAYSTGSSMMPQKRNPDALELARASSGRMLGDLTALLATLKGLPSGYNKDLQDDKRALFDAVDATLLVLPAVAGAVGELTFDTARMRPGAGGDDDGHRPRGLPGGEGDDLPRGARERRPPGARERGGRARAAPPAAVVVHRRPPALRARRVRRALRPLLGRAARGGRRHGPRRRPRAARGGASGAPPGGGAARQRAAAARGVAAPHRLGQASETARRGEIRAGPSRCRACPECRGRAATWNQLRTDAEADRRELHAALLARRVVLHENVVEPRLGVGRQAAQREAGADAGVEAEVVARLSAIDVGLAAVVADAADQVRPHGDAGQRVLRVGRQAEDAHVGHREAADVLAGELVEHPVEAERDREGGRAQADAAGHVVAHRLHLAEVTARDRRAGGDAEGDRALRVGGRSTDGEGEGEGGEAENSALHATSSFRT
jgi:argininosuccinate lyase